MGKKHARPAEPERRQGAEPRGLLDSEPGGYQLKSRTERDYPQLFQPVNQEFWKGINTDQADALTKLQAIAMEKVGFERGTPKFFIDEDAGSAYAADDYFVGGERARVTTPRSVIGQSEAELAYAERRDAKAKWLRSKQDKRRKALQRESESDGGMNFFVAVQAEVMAQETELLAVMQKEACPEYDGPALMIGGMLIGAGLFLAIAGAFPIFAENYTEMMAQIMPIAGLIAAAFGMMILFNHSPN